MLGLADFVGEWSVSRTIDDRLTGSPGRFDGQARFRAEASALRYREEGVLRLGDGPEFPASRDYVWRWEGATVAVEFGDGRPFHRFVPEGEGDGTDHPCGADLYRVRYDFSGWPLWSADWEVAGPSKSYRMRSRYARA